MQSLYPCFFSFPLKTLRSCRLFQRIHDVRPQGILNSAYNIVARMEKVSVLEEQDATNLGDDIYALVHIKGVECGRTTFQLLLAIFVHGIIEVEVQGKV